jgi:hypothetical protein
MRSVRSAMPAMARSFVTRRIVMCRCPRGRPSRFMIWIPLVESSDPVGSSASSRRGLLASASCDRYPLALAPFDAARRDGQVRGVDVIEAGGHGPPDERDMLLLVFRRDPSPAAEISAVCGIMLAGRSSFCAPQGAVGSHDRPERVLVDGVAGRFRAAEGGDRQPVDGTLPRAPQPPPHTPSPASDAARTRRHPPADHLPRDHPPPTTGPAHGAERISKSPANRPLSAQPRAHQLRDSGYGTPTVDPRSGFPPTR